MKSAEILIRTQYTGWAYELLDGNLTPMTKQEGLEKKLPKELWECFLGNSKRIGSQ